MKKVLAIVAVSAMCLAANAQKVHDRKVMTPSNMEVSNFLAKNRVVKSMGTLNREVAPSATLTRTSMAKVRQNTKTTVPGVEVSYDNPTNCLYSGINPNFASVFTPVVITPAFKDITWWNYCNDGQTLLADVAWSCKANGEEIESTIDEKHNYTAQVWGYIGTPTITFTPDGTTYKYGLSTALSPAHQQYVGQGWWSGGMYEMDWITNADVVEGGNYADFGPDRATGRLIAYETNQIFYGKTQKCMGFAQYLGDPGDYLYVDSLTLMCAFGDYKTLNVADALEGKTLYADIYEIVDGIVQEEPVATAKATSAEVYSEVEYQMTSISYAFAEEDELFGEVAAPIVLAPGKDYMIELTGFEQLSQSVTAIFSANLGVGGNAYAILEDGDYATIGYSNAPNIPMADLDICLHGLIPTASIDPAMPKALHFPAEGGMVETYNYNDVPQYDFDIATYNGVDEWEMTECPDWIKAEVDDSYLKTQGYLLFYFTAEPLPAGVEGRGGEIVLSLYGKDFVIPVGQGNYDGIQGVVAENNQKKNFNVSYNLLGQRVAANAKGVVVRGGKKLLQK